MTSCCTQPLSFWEEQITNGRRPCYKCGRRANWRRIHICRDLYWGHSSFSAEDNWLQSVNGQRRHLEAGNTNSYLPALNLCWETRFPIMQSQRWYSSFWGIWFHDTSKWWRHKKSQRTFPSWSTMLMLLLGCICISTTLISILFPLPLLFHVRFNNLSTGRDIIWLLQQL